MKAVIISDCVYNRLNNYLSYIVETPDTTYNVSPSRAFEKWNELINALVKKLGNGLVSYPRTKYSQLGKSIGCKQFNYIMSKTHTQFCFGYLEDNDCVLVCYMENSSMVKNEAVDRVCNYNMKSNSEDKDNHSYCVLNPNQIKYISNKTFSDSPNMYKDKQHNTMNNTKKRIRLTESQLSDMIKMAISEAINEKTSDYEPTPVYNFIDKERQRKFRKKLLDKPSHKIRNNIKSMFNGNYDEIDVNDDSIYNDNELYGQTDWGDELRRSIDESISCAIRKVLR